MESLEPRLLLTVETVWDDLSAGDEALAQGGPEPNQEQAWTGYEMAAQDLGVATTQVLIAGVPIYLWYRGCGPTAAGMVVGYWDMHGCPNLIPGDSSTQTTAASYAIASTEHYNDYSLPIDSSSTGLLADKSQTGGAHASNSVADWMRTSWSSAGNYYGWSWFSDVDDAISGYVASRGYMGFSVLNKTWSGFTWDNFKTEINNNRPVVFLVDTDGNGSTDHFVPAIGYDDATTRYACYNTWDSSVHWYSFAKMASGQAWGIYGATLTSLTADTTAPLVTFTAFSGDIDHPSVTNATTASVSGTATDPESGIIADAYHFHVRRFNGTGWDAPVDYGPNSGSATISSLTDGLYAVSLLATNGQQMTAESAYRYLQVDTTAPALSGTMPADNATGVARSANLTMAFNEVVQKGAGDIVLHLSGDGSVVETIAVSSTRVVVAGSTVTVDPSAELQESTGYYVTVPDGAFLDSVGNRFSGLNGATAWNFTTGDFTPPTVGALSPSPGTAGVALDADLAIDFNEAVQKGEGDIVLHRSGDGSVVETIAVSNGRVAIAGSSVTIDLATSLLESTVYYVTVAEGAILDLAGNRFSGISGPTAWSFTTADFTRPGVSALSPLPGSSGLVLDPDLAIAFNEAVQKGEGDIVLHLSGDGSVVETIAVSSDRVTIAGSVATVDPATSLLNNTGYYVTVAEGAFLDLAGNRFSGISGPTAWSFTTGDFTPPTVSELSPPDGASDVAIDANFVITFSESVRKGDSGSVLIRKSSDDSVLETIDVASSSVTVVEAQVTIDPVAMLAGGCSYYVQVEPGTFEDLAGNGFAGFTSTTAWDFTSGASGNLDIDGNGRADALTDGILILRYLFDPAGAWNYSDALGGGATRTTRPAVASWLEVGRTNVLDVDGNGTPDALTDGILILRYLFDPAGAWNYSDALGSGATRTTRAAIKAHLDQYVPASGVPEAAAAGVPASLPDVEDGSVPAAVSAAVVADVGVQPPVGGPIAEPTFHGETAAERVAAQDVVLHQYDRTTDHPRWPEDLSGIAARRPGGQRGVSTATDDLFGNDDPEWFFPR